MVRRSREPRQLKLFQDNPVASQVLLERRRAAGAQPPVSAIVLGTPAFYTAAGAKAATVAPAQELINAMRSSHKLDIRLAIWDRSSRSIQPVNHPRTSDQRVAAEGSFLDLVNRIRAAAVLDPVPCLAPPVPFPSGDGRELISIWLSQTLGGEVTLEAKGTRYLPGPGTDLRKLAETLPSARVDARRFVRLPTAFSTLITAWPDWTVTDLNGVLLGWHYPVPVPGSTDAWGWQALTEPLDDQTS